MIQVITLTITATLAKAAQRENAHEAHLHPSKRLTAKQSETIEEFYKVKDRAARGSPADKDKSKLTNLADKIVLYRSCDICNSDVPVYCSDFDRHSHHERLLVNWGNCASTNSKRDMLWKRCSYADLDDGSKHDGINAICHGCAPKYFEENYGTDPGLEAVKNIPESKDDTKNKVQNLQKRFSERMMQKYEMGEPALRYTERQLRSLSIDELKKYAHDYFITIPKCLDEEDLEFESKDEAYAHLSDKYGEDLSEPMSFTGSLLWQSLDEALKLSDWKEYLQAIYLKRKTDVISIIHRALRDGIAGPKSYQLEAQKREDLKRRTDPERAPNQEGAVKTKPTSSGELES